MSPRALFPCFLSSATVISFTTSERLWIISVLSDHRQVISGFSLNADIADSAIQLTGLACYRADREASLSGKSLGGGLCVNVNKLWCTNLAKVSRHCSPQEGFLIVKCYPFYREFSSILVIAVYLHTKANANTALGELSQAINKLQTAHPEAFLVIAGNINHVNLKTVLTKFPQHVHFFNKREELPEVSSVPKPDPPLMVWQKCVHWSPSSRSVFSLLQAPLLI